MKLIKIGAEWCGPCCTMDERLKNFTACEVVKYDIDNDTDQTIADIVDKYKVKSIPVIVLVDDNNTELKKWVGAVQIKEILDEIAKH